MYIQRNGSVLSYFAAFLFSVAFVGFAPNGFVRGDVVSGNMAPRIERVNSVLYSGFLYVTGYVIDRENDDPTGWSVYFDGDVSGSAEVGSDGKFWFKVPYYYPYGEASVTTQDPDGEQSNTVNFEFYE